jgi:tRNA pseudouridine(38-40) synthase
MPYYKLIMAYDGSRFNGFQRQITNERMESRVSVPGLAANREPQEQRLDNTTTGPPEQPASATRRAGAVAVVPKRPHWDSAAPGRKKRVACTVQDCIEDSIRSWTGQSAEGIGMRFAGRTDAGVHARGQVIRVALSLPPHPLEEEGGEPKRWEAYEIQKSINSRLPTDISVVDVQEVQVNDEGEPLFDPRHDATGKQYSYTLKFRRKAYGAPQVTDGAVQVNDERWLLPICNAGPHSFRHAFDSPCCWVVPWPLEDFKMRQLCSFLSGRHNFVAFVHKDNRNKSKGDEGQHVVTLEKAEFAIVSESKEDAPVVTAQLVFEAKSFQRSMVRNLVGFCVDVCRGLPDVSNGFNWSDVWEEKSAFKVHSAPACGLCLEWVRY